MYAGRRSVDDHGDGRHRHGALWDIKGKHFGEPIHRLLGGKQHDRILAYASILFGKNGDETARIGARWREAGYSAVKFGWEPMGTERSGRPRTWLSRRKGVGDDGIVLVDAGCVWDARTALERAKAFEQQKIGWLEEPLHPDDYEGYRWLRDRSPVPIAAGEEECGRQSFRPADRRPVPGRLSGRPLPQRLHRLGLHPGPRRGDRARLCNHCYTSPVTVAASLALAQHLPRRVPVRRLRRGLAAPPRADEREGPGGGRLDHGPGPSGAGGDTQRGLRPVDAHQRVDVRWGRRPVSRDASHRKVNAIDERFRVLARDGDRSIRRRTRAADQSLEVTSEASISSS